jgi:hypothetical protein
MSVVQRKAMLKAEGFFPHKKNAKGTTIIYSRKHPSAKFVRVVVDSGIDSKTGKVVGKVGVKLCFVNRQKSWREITTQVFTTNTGLVKTIRAQEAAEKFVKNCKHCKAKKFTAKSGNVVCANACWTKWSGKKKAASPKKKKSQTKVTPKHKRTYPLNAKGSTVGGSVKKKSQKKSQKKFVAEILPGDLVTVEEISSQTIINDFTGSILGIVTSVESDRVEVDWTANTTTIEPYMLPCWTCYYPGSARDYRFKVLSRKVEYAIAG